ncbi:MAG TPA: hypothetical protein VFP84_18250, partial [Kofleriaceae bacterium]|nr:hypothetical protein [Kofleriaceae bacterium]
GASIGRPRGRRRSAARSAASCAPTRRAAAGSRASSGSGRTAREVAGSCHGFLVERWVDGTPLSATALTGDARQRFVDHVGRYLGFRARHLPAGPGRGASLVELAEMARRNTSLALGAPVTLPGAPAALAARVVPVEIDGALHAHEWLMRGDAPPIKADAHDHHAAHDLIGCQDLAWDVAGAIVELALSSAEQARLIAVTGEAAGRPVDLALLAFLRPCYLAFQLGRHALAADSDPDEAPRLRAAVARYAAQLR